MSDLKNKNVFITGATRGIGLGIANRFAAEGANVIFTYNRSTETAQELDQKFKALGVRSAGLQVDSGDAAALQKAVKETVELFGPIDILINNAGIAPFAEFQDITLDGFDEIVNVNVKAVFAACHAVIEKMPEGGRIISIGSNMADNVFTGDATLYSMTKSALQGFTKGLARALGPKKITVNLVQPGPVDTDMNPADTEFADFLRSRMSLPDYGTPEDIAGFVAFLAGSEGKFITGSVLTIDGGMNA